MLKIFFNSNFSEDGLSEKLSGTLRELGTIDSDNLEDAFLLCQNISADCWIKDPMFTPTGVNISERVRSFSMGDVVERNGVQYICAMVGFKELK